MHSNGKASMAQPRPRPPRREFVTTIGTEDLGRYAGVGLTLDQVIEEELKNVETTAFGSVEESDDLVIWERNKIAALIRIGSEGRPVVTRLDRPSCPAAPPLATDNVPVMEAMAAVTVGTPMVSETLAAITHYHVLRRFTDEKRKLHEAGLSAATGAAADPDHTLLGHWTSLAGEALAVTERLLRRSIRDLEDTFKSLIHGGDDGSRWSHCGIVLDGRLYLALASETGGTLVVVDLKNLARLDPGRGAGHREIP